MAAATQAPAGAASGVYIAMIIIWSLWCCGRKMRKRDGEWLELFLFLCVIDL